MESTAKARTSPEERYKNVRWPKSFQQGKEMKEELVTQACTLLDSIIEKAETVHSSNQRDLKELSVLIAQLAEVGEEE